MKAVIEVGANIGTDTARLLREYDCPIISFEPVPKLFEELQKKFSQQKRLTLLSAAVGNENTTAVFHITPEVAKQRARHGASSLFEFREELKDEWNRADFCVNEKIEVEVWRLDKIIQEKNITEIPYLHCDAQGNDLNVIRGLGDYVNIVKQGVIEVTKDLPLYKNTDNTLAIAEKLLPSMGFTITGVRANDRMNSEVNVYFKR